jgi:hypothetical protein
MSGDVNSQEKNFRNGLIAALSNREQIPTLEEVEALAKQMAPFFITRAICGTSSMRP